MDIYVARSGQVQAGSHSFFEMKTTLMVLKKEMSGKKYVLSRTVVGHMLVNKESLE